MHDFKQNEIMKKKEKNENYKYVGSVELYLKRIEVFSFSNLMCPFYTIQALDGQDYTFGGAVGKSLREMENPIEDSIFESRIFSGPFVNDIYWLFTQGESLNDYSVALLHHKIADTGFFKQPARVLIDVFSNGKDSKYALGGSTYMLERDKDGKIGIRMDGIEMQKMGLCNLN